MADDDAGDMGLLIRSVVVAWFALLFTRAPALVRLAGPAFVRYLGLGLPAGPNGLLTVRGRTTGRPRSVPVAVLRLDGRWLVQAPYGEAQWVRNLRATPRATLKVGRRTLDVDAAELPPEEAARTNRELLAANPRSRLVRTVLAGDDRPPVGILHYFGLRIDSGYEAYLADARKHPTFELRAATQS